ncbi:MAG: hypothetical protein P8H03_05480 [Emcibacteraceae bacterium]|nr:hypothetical protein [Emcibacteraceae bacterium]
MRKIFILVLLFPFYAFADTAAGITALNAGQYEKAYIEFKAASESGDADAHYQLGLMFQEGQHVEKQDFDALLHFEKAGHLGHIDAMREAIRYHLNGWGVIPNRALAAIWIKLSADANPKKYLNQFKRFYGKLTTYERIEYEERLERKRY